MTLLSNQAVDKSNPHREDLSACGLGPRDGSVMQENGPFGVEGFWLGSEILRFAQNDKGAQNEKIMVFKTLKTGFYNGN